MIVLSVCVVCILEVDVVHVLCQYAWGKGGGHVQRGRFPCFLHHTNCIYRYFLESFTYIWFVKHLSALAGSLQHDQFPVKCERQWLPDRPSLTLR